MKTKPQRPITTTVGRLTMLFLFTVLAGCPATSTPAPAPLDTSTSDLVADSATDTAAETSADSTPDTAGPAIRSITIDVGTMTFLARTAGPADGEPVLLLHGFPETSFEWRAQLLALGEAGYYAVAPDQRGYSPGARPPNVEDYTIDLLVADVVGMADALGFPTFHLVGHDWGAAVAWAVSGAHPQRLTTLTAVSIPHLDAFSAALADTESCQYEASAYFDLFSVPNSEAAFLGNDAALLLGVYDGLEQAAIDEYFAVLATEAALGAALNWYRANMANRTFTSPAIGVVTVDTLFIWSDGDSAVCIEPAQATAALVSGPYRFETIAGTDHWVPENAADAVSALLLEHLAK